MAEKSLEQRVSALEAQLGGKTLQEHFREQAELIDQLFSYRFEEMDKRWDAKLDAKLATLEFKLETNLETKLETKLESKLEPIRNDMAAVKKAVQIILTRLT
jgi:hypothetical protein